MMTFTFQENQQRNGFAKTRSSKSIMFRLGYIMPKNGANMAVLFDERLKAPNCAVVTDKGA
jgi:hypothetical protein